MSVTIEMHCADVHCHLLPGIDDGPQDWNDTLAMARIAVSEGIDTIIATPHQLGRFGTNTASRIRSLVAEAQRRLDLARIPLTVLPGADVHIRDDLPELVERREVLTLGDHFAHLLVEIPPELSLSLGTLLDRLQRQGVACILTHPERNHAQAQNFEFVRRWVAQRGLVQITAASVTGHFGPTAKKVARDLVREGLVHLAATDAHGAKRRPPLVREAHNAVTRWAGPSVAHSLFVRNPRAVAQGQPIPDYPPVAPIRQSLAAWCSRAAASLWGMGA